MSASATIAQKLKTWQAGAAVMGLGAVLLAAGLLVTTSAAPPAECPAGSTLVSKYKANNGTYTFEKPSGNDNVVTLSNTTAGSGNWNSSVPIVYMIVKAGPDSITTSFSPAQTSGSWDNLGFLVGSGQHPNISDVLFCQSTTPATTTTTQPTTTTTAPATTTSTAMPTTTTTWQSTTSTQPFTTSTVHAGGSTSTSTWTSTSTSTTLPTTTTTLPPTTTTTGTSPPSEGTTSTTVAGSTTTVAAAGSTSTTVASDATTTTTYPSKVGSAGAVVTSTSIGTSSPESGSLPRTGGESTPLVVTGVVCLVAGLAMTLLALKRRRTA